MGTPLVHDGDLLSEAHFRTAVGPHRYFLTGAPGVISKAARHVPGFVLAGLPTERGL